MGNKILTLLTAATVGFFSAALGITAGQLPDELTVSAAGSTRLCTLLPTQAVYDGSGSQASAKLFGWLKLRSLPVSVASPQKVYLGGTLFGVKMYSDGVMVVGLSDFSSGGRSANPARDAGIAEGDVIRAVNGQPVYTNDAFSRLVEQSGGGSLTLSVVGQNGSPRSVTLTPLYSEGDRALKTGMWVRDSAAGIGTLTFIEPSGGVFGGLGHGICDSDTRSIIPLHGGEIVSAQFAGIQRGVRGAAGGIRGFLGTEKLGIISANTFSGTFGRYTAPFPAGEEYEVARKQEVREGKARLLCTVEADGKPKFYDVVISKVNYSSAEPTRNMIITVTDPELLRLTGGIVQGMSGSPIVQNGKLVGAVTHVFVNDPARGYAIFAENMLKKAHSS